MRIIGVDYGSRRTGIAIWDGQVNLYLPMMVIENKDLGETAQSVADIAFFERADLIVVGHPLTLSGEASGEQIEATDRFLSILRDRTTLPVDTEDERLTSDLAERLNLDAGRRSAAASDALAAAAILETYVLRVKPQDKPPAGKGGGDGGPVGHGNDDPGDYGSLYQR